MTDSIYDQLNAYGTVAKQRFVENFSGDSLDADRWTVFNLQGTGSTTMGDSVNGGFTVTSGTNENDSTGINFNNIRQYSNNASVFIGVMKRDTSNAFVFCGFQETTALTGVSFSQAINDTATTKIGIQTNDGTNGGTYVASTINNDSSRHNYKIELGGSNNILFLDGILNSTATSDLPTSKLQPFFREGTKTTAAKTSSILYMEAYNT